ncbi:unnamed protein product, partial [Ectocarpus sp. 12 AP-2014]
SVEEEATHLDLEKMNVLLRDMPAKVDAHKPTPAVDACLLPSVHNKRSSPSLLASRSSIDTSRSALISSTTG